MPSPAAALTTAEFAALMAPLGPFGDAPRLAAGVSGGPHSLALALLAAAWIEARGGTLLALVVDHGLRPDSAAEASGVATLLATRGIPARVIALGLPPGSGLQARARAGRRAAMLAACREAATPWLLLGQHRADQAETLLFRALRGSGPDGLAAMAPVAAAAEALVLRPLLGVAPARLEAVVATAGLRPVRDPANAHPRFARSRLRAVLADPDGTGEATAALAHAAAAFAVRRSRLATAVASRLAVAARLLPTGFAEIDPVALGADAVADAALAALVRAVGGGAYPPSAVAVAALRCRGHGTLGDAQLTPGWLLLREASAVAPPVPARRGTLWDRRFRLVGPGDAAGGEGYTIGALGAGLPRLPPLCPPPSGLSRMTGLRAVIRATLPAIWRNGVLVAVPPLDYPDPAVASRFTMLFAPVAGPASTPPGACAVPSPEPLNAPRPGPFNDRTSNPI